MHSEHDTICAFRQKCRRIPKQLGSWSCSSYSYLKVNMTRVLLGRKRRRFPEQLGPEVWTTEIAPGVLRDVGALPQSSRHDHVPLLWLWAGIVQHARVPLHILVSCFILKTLWSIPHRIASGFISFIFKAVHKLQEMFQAKLLFYKITALVMQRQTTCHCSKLNFTWYFSSYQLVYLQ